MNPFAVAQGNENKVIQPTTPNLALLHTIADAEEWFWRRHRRRCASADRRRARMTWMRNYNWPVSACRPSVVYRRRSSYRRASFSLSRSSSPLIEWMMPRLQLTSSSPSFPLPPVLLGRRVADSYVFPNHSTSRRRGRRPKSFWTSS